MSEDERIEILVTMVKRILALGLTDMECLIRRELKPEFEEKLRKNIQIVLAGYDALLVEGPTGPTSEQVLSLVKQVKERDPLTVSIPLNVAAQKAFEEASTGDA